MSKQYSSMKIFHHKEILDAIERGEQTAPLYIRLKPTNLCNQHCHYCTYGNGNSNEKTWFRDEIDKRDMIPKKKIREILQDIAEIGVKAVTFSGGGTAYLPVY